MFAVLAALLVGGCAAPTTQRVAVTNKQTAEEARKQMELFAEDYVGEMKRLRKVHWELATRAVALCPRKAADIGVQTATSDRSELGAVMARLYGLGDEPTVLFAVDGGPAQAAGVQPRDRIVSMYGIAVKDAKAIAEKRRSAPEEPMPLVLQRGSETITLTARAVPACDYPVRVENQQIVNASADGERIAVTRGMMAFARTDEELALVVAHEMAHNTMRHIEAKRQNAAGGLVADIALAILTRGAYRQSSISQAASQAYSQEFEAEADYVGLYMLARTGYTIDDAPRFWRRMAAAYPASIKSSHSSSRPSTSYRMVALEAAVKEIAGKRSTGVALLPERKDGKEVVPGVPATARQDTAGSTCLVAPNGQCSR